MNQPTHIVTVELDENGDHVIDLPPEMLGSLGWNEHTKLKWEAGEDVIVIRKIDDDRDARVSGYVTLGLVAAVAMSIIGLVVWVVGVSN